jgi:hypothetical protein
MRKKEERERENEEEQQRSNSNSCKKQAKVLWTMGRFKILQ